MRTSTWRADHWQDVFNFAFDLEVDWKYLRFMITVFGCGFVVETVPEPLPLNGMTKAEARVWLLGLLED